MLAAVQPARHDLHEHAVRVLVGQVGVASGSGRNHLDRPGVIHAQPPLDHVERVDRAAGQAPSAEVAAEVPGDDVQRLPQVDEAVVERPPRGRPEPQVPVEAVGDRFGRQVDLRCSCPGR